MRKSKANRGPTTLRELQAEHKAPPSGVAEEETEQSRFRNYFRDLVLGFNDGVVSVYALCMGVVGAAFSNSAVGLAGVAAAIGGAASMGLGEYVSTKSQSQYYESEARRERHHIRTHGDLEREELRGMLVERGYPPSLRKALALHITRDEDRFVDFMMREEFGVGRESSRSPIVAMLLVMGAFVVGAALPVIPFVVAAGSTATAAASAMSLLGLFAAGALRARLSGLNAWLGGAEMALLGAAAAAVTFGAGYAVDYLLADAA